MHSNIWSLNQAEEPVVFPRPLSMTCTFLSDASRPLRNLVVAACLLPLANVKGAFQYPSGFVTSGTKVCSGCYLSVAMSFGSLGKNPSMSLSIIRFKKKQQEESVGLLRARSSDCNGWASYNTMPRNASLCMHQYLSNAVLSRIPVQDVS